MEKLTTMGDGTARDFLRRWYGFSGSDELDPARVGPDTPPELVEWHAAAVLAGVPVTFQDRPVPLPDLAPSSDGTLTFWVENQCGYYWAVGLDDGRRVVYRESGASEWLDSGEDLDRFLLHCTVREAIIGAESKATALVPEDMLDGVLESFSRLSFIPFASEEPSAQLWGSDEALARVVPPLPGYVQPDERIVMITIAVPDDTNIREYIGRLQRFLPERDVSGEVPRRLAPIYEPPPF